MNQQQEGLGFEQKIEMLESLVSKMEGGGLKLEELLEQYGIGMRLSQELMQELDAAQAKMQILKNGLLTPMEDEHEV